jgi:carbon storage regulator
LGKQKLRSRHSQAEKFQGGKKVMLVLSRKIGEQIHIGDDIVLTVVEIKGGRVKLGLQAPLDCSIQRSELKMPTLPNGNTSGATSPRKAVGAALVAAH